MKICVHKNGKKHHNAHTKKSKEKSKVCCYFTDIVFITKLVMNTVPGLEPRKLSNVPF